MEFLKVPDFGSSFSFPENQKFELEDGIARLTGQICVQMAEQYDDAVIAEIVNAARACGVSDCVVLNKKAIIEALFRMTPKKPFEEWCGWLHRFECPSCGATIDRYNNKFCARCGQAIDWEDNNAR